MRVFVFILGVLSYAMAFTQNVGISNTAITPDVSAGMEVRYTNKGVLIPRVALTSVTDAATIATPATSLLVYCTGTGGLSPAGYYYNSGTPAAPNWVKMATGTSLDDAWKLLGNAGTNPATNFLGTTDAQDLVFRTNNTERMRILSGGNVGIGTTAPTQRLHVLGNSLVSTNMYVNSIASGVIHYGNTGLYGSTTTFNPNGTNNGVWLEGSNDGEGGGFFANGNCAVIWSPGDADILRVYDEDNLPAGNPRFVVDAAGDVGINAYPVTVSAALEITATNKGLLIPRVALSATNNNTPVGASVVEGLLVYNTATSGVSPNNVVPGFYYWDGAQWVHFSVGAAGNDWTLTGNAGTTTGTNFIGTTDNRELDFRTNNIIRLRMTTKGQLETMNTGHSVFIGEMAGENDDLTDNYNVAIGYQALYDNTTGINNVAIGDNALPNNISGNYNIAIGDEADLSNTSGGYNISLGFWAGRAGSIVNDNVAIGRYALYQNLGGYNTGVGYAAGAGVSGPTYTYCTYIGYDADFSVSGTYTNAMALGNGATVTASNRVRVGNTSITRIGGQVGWTTISDGRVKKNVSEDVSGIDFIMKLRPVTYTLDKNTQDEILNSPDATVRPDKYEIEKTRFSGFIAQEVEIAANEVGYDFSGVKKPAHENDLYGLTYSDFVVPLVKATQEQQLIIEQQQRTIEMLQQQNADILKRLEKLEAD